MEQPKNNFVDIHYAQRGTSSNTDEFGMREMQAKAYQYRDKRFLLIKAPPASGKSRALMFIALVLLFINPISAFMGYADHQSYIWVMAITVAIDAFQCIPFAYLRYKKRPIKFAALKLLNIFMAITLNIVFFLILPNI